RRAGMAGVGLLHGVHRQRADGIGERAPRQLRRRARGTRLRRCVHGSTSPEIERLAARFTLPRGQVVYGDKGSLRLHEPTVTGGSLAVSWLRVTRNACIFAYASPCGNTACSRPSGYVPTLTSAATL